MLFCKRQTRCLSLSLCLCLSHSLTLSFSLYFRHSSNTLGSEKSQSVLLLGGLNWHSLVVTVAKSKHSFLPTLQAFLTDVAAFSDMISFGTLLIKSVWDSIKGLSNSSSPTIYFHWLVVLFMGLVSSDGWKNSFSVFYCEVVLHKFICDRSW